MKKFLILAVFLLALTTACGGATGPSETSTTDGTSEMVAQATGSSQTSQVSLTQNDRLQVDEDTKPSEVIDAPPTGARDVLTLSASPSSLLSDSEREELEGQVGDARLFVDMVIACSDGDVVDPIAQGGTAEEALLMILGVLTPELQACIVDRLVEGSR